MTAGDECPHCNRLEFEVVDERGEMFYPMAAELDDILTARYALRKKRAPLVLAMTAFAEELYTWENADAYASADKETTSNMAIESFFPVGTFMGDKDPVSKAYFTGTVESAERRRNHETQGEFDWALVKTLGMSVDVVAAPGDRPELRPGNVIQGMFWCIATVVEGIKLTSSRGVIDRLLRR